MQEDHNTILRENELKAFRYLVFYIWEKEYGRFPLIYGKEYGDSYSSEVSVLRNLLISSYGMKDHQTSGIDIKDPDKNFRDIISDIIKGRNSSLPTTDKVDALAHCYYQNTNFQHDPHADWQRFLNSFAGDGKIQSPEIKRETEPAEGLITEEGSAIPAKFLGFNICLVPVFMKLVAVCCLIIMCAAIAISSFTVSSTSGMLPSTASVIISGLQILMLLAFIYIYFRERKLTDPKAQIIQATVMQFESSWIAILTSLLFLYIWFSMEILLVKLNTAVYLSTGDILTSISSFLFFYAYSILENKSLNTVHDEGRNRHFKISNFISALICIMLCMLSVLERFGQIPASYVFIVKLLFAIYPAVTVSLFIERLSSRTLIKSRTIIPFLYAY